MTRPDMNAPSRKKSGLAAIVVLVSGGLGACVGAFDPPTDPASPLALRVDELVAANRTYPQWRDFPRASADMPTPSQVAGLVGGLRSEGVALAQESAAIAWTLDDPAAFAAATAARVDATRVAPVTQVTVDRVDAFARELRERGRAPPPIPR